MLCFFLLSTPNTVTGSTEGRRHRYIFPDRLHRASRAEPQVPSQPEDAVVIREHQTGFPNLCSLVKSQGVGTGPSQGDGKGKSFPVCSGTFPAWVDQVLHLIQGHQGLGCLALGLRRNPGTCCVVSGKSVSAGAQPALYRTKDLDSPCAHFLIFIESGSEVRIGVTQCPH